MFLYRLGYVNADNNMPTDQDQRTKVNNLFFLDLVMNIIRSQTSHITQTLELLFDMDQVIHLVHTKLQEIRSE